MKAIGLRGSIENVLFCRVAVDELKSVQASEAGYSFGLGAVADTAGGAVGSLGELLTAPDVAAYLPGDGLYRPRIVRDPSAKVFTPFNVVLRGVGRLPLRPLGEGGEELTAAQIWGRVLERAAAEGAEGPLYGGVFFAEIISLRGSFVRRPPLPEAAPPGGAAISDPAHHAEWFGLDPDGGARGAAALVVAAALDPSSPGLAALEGMERHIFYRHPDAPRLAAGVQVHQHLLVLERGAEIGRGSTVEEATAWILGTGRVIDVKHVLDDSRFRRVSGAWLGYETIERMA